MKQKKVTGFHLGRGFKITKSRHEMSAEEVKALYACDHMVHNHLTLAETAKDCGYSTTTFWRRVHNECKELAPGLYKDVCHQMKLNLARRRWG